MADENIGFEFSLGLNGRPLANEGGLSQRSLPPSQWNKVRDDPRPRPSMPRIDENPLEHMPNGGDDLSTDAWTLGLKVGHLITGRGGSLASLWPLSPERVLGWYVESISVSLWKSVMVEEA